jgi:CheY-like chemotaxis protein/Tfp pilus assembly protein PilZ
MRLPIILLVDDTRLLLEMEMTYLDNSQVEILTALNGEEALQIMKVRRPDLVVLDQSMPKMSGTTCCAAMRRDPDLLSIPVLMISSSISREDQEEYTKAGCTDFLAKPVERRQFLEKIRTFIPSIERRGPRVACRTGLEMKIAGTPVSGFCEDIGLGGLYVATDFTAQEGSVISLKFRLPDKGDEPPVTAWGRVAWLNTARNRKNIGLPAGFGVEFIEITGEGMPLLRKKEISDFIRKHARQDSKEKKR